MAEIKIEKKAPVWPWILGILLVAGIAYYFMTRDEDTVVETEETTVITTNNANEDQTTESQDAIAAYVSFIDNPDMDLEHTYTSEALHKLIEATRSAAQSNSVDIEANLRTANEKADEMTKNPQSMEHPDVLKEAAENIAGALKTIQTEKFTSLNEQYNDVEKAVEKIDVKKETLQQKDAVKDFFDKAATLLTSIKNSYGQ